MNTTPRISVCIPAYDMGGQGAAFLTRSLEHLTGQSFGDFEVVVADQSDSGDVSAVCDQYTDRLRLNRVDTRNAQRSASANCNGAMQAASGEILKILFQDDFLTVPTALETINRSFEDQSSDWFLCGSCVTHDGVILENQMIPRLNPNLYLGKNTVSSPSVLALRSDAGLRFDERLIWLMDVEFYKRCHDRFGPPAICPDPLVANFLHSDQVSARVTPALRRKELRYVRHKHRKTESFGNRLHFLMQILKAK